MSTTQLETDFAQAVRAELTAIGTRNSGLQRHQRHVRTLALGVGVLALAGVTTGAAVVINNLPGTITVEPFGTVITVTHTGAATIDLGPIPSEADVVAVDLTCISDTGIVSVNSIPQADGTEQGSGIQCARNAGGTAHFNNVLLPAAGTTTITITAPERTTWSAAARYATSATEPWGVNMNGQTYGIGNAEGEPDLIRARADNGAWGYTSTEEVSRTDEEGSVNVYESDGTTVIGQQAFHVVANIPLDPALIPEDTESDGG